MALAVMGELEIDISAQQPKSIELFLSGERISATRAAQVAGS